LESHSTVDDWLSEAEGLLCSTGGQRLYRELELSDAKKNGLSLAQFSRWCRVRGILCRQCGLYDESLLCLTNACLAAKSNFLDTSSAELSKSTNALASLYLDLHLYEIALQKTNDLLLLSSTALVGDELLIALDILGLSYLHVGQAQVALYYFHLMLDRNKNIRLNSYHAKAYLRLGMAYHRLGRLAESATAFDTSINIGRHLEDLILTADLLSTIIEYGMHTTIDHGSTFQLAFDRARANGHDLDAFKLADCLARQYCREKRYELAIETFDTTLKNIEADQALRCVTTFKSSYAQLLISLNSNLNFAGDLIEDCLAATDLRLDAAVFDDTRAIVVSKDISVFEAKIDLLTRAGPASFERHNHIELALELHEKAKSQAFARAIGVAKHLRGMTLSTEPLIRAQYDLAIREREVQLVERETVSEYCRYWAISDLKDSRDRLAGEIAKQQLPCLEIRQTESSILPDLLRVLHANVEHRIAIASFFCGKEKTTCFFIKPGMSHPSVHEANVGRDQLFDVARALKRYFNGSPLSFPPTLPIQRSKPFRRSIQSFQDICAPLLGFAGLLDDVDLLCIAPHGPLHLLPIHAIRVEGKFLIESVAVTYTPSITVLKYLLDQSDAPANGAAKKSASTYIAGIASSDDANKELLELAFAQSTFSQTQEYGPIQASKANVARGLCQNSVVHISAHGYFKDSDPLQSGLLVSNGIERPPRSIESLSPIQRRQFILSVRDILRSTIHADLVTLRACSLGAQVEKHAGDEFDGLSRALLSAGARAVIVALWNVDASSSQELLSNFYQIWDEGMDPNIPKWRALQLAQLRMIHSGIDYLQHPYHWAPFVLLGDFR